MIIKIKKSHVRSLCASSQEATGGCAATAMSEQTKRKEDMALKENTKEEAEECPGQWLYGRKVADPDWNRDEDSEIRDSFKKVKLVDYPVHLNILRGDYITVIVMLKGKEK